MSVDHIRYDLLAQEALRGVVRRVLIDVAKTGLPGEHHLYISFDTQAPGVRLSQRMREKYPEEMTIVLQHQFWDLIVTEHSFEVGLSFAGVPERVLVPFDALKGLFDPSVLFGLQFETVADLADAMTKTEPRPGEETKPAPRRGRAQSAESKAEPTEAESLPAPAPAPLPAAAPKAPLKAVEQDGEPDKPSGGAQVVKFDRFRKKK